MGKRGTSGSKLSQPQAMLLRFDVLQPPVHVQTSGPRLSSQVRCFSRPSLQTVDAIRTLSSVPFALWPARSPRLRRVSPPALDRRVVIASHHHFTNRIVVPSPLTYHLRAFGFHIHSQHQSHKMRFSNMWLRKSTYKSR
jgi:hypothetical protein